MTVRSFPFYGQDSAEDDYYRLHRESGVISGLDLTLNGLGWSLSTGEAKAGGSMMLVEDTPATGASVPTSGANPRRDMLVARRTLLPDGGSETVPALLQGSTAATPVDPTPEDDVVGVFDEPLFSWQVPASGGTVITGVRDLRRAADRSPRPISSMAARPTTDRYLGTCVRPMDRPNVTYSWDQTRWVQDGVNSESVTGAPSGSYVSRYEESVTTKIVDGNGRFQAPLPRPFSAKPLLVASVQDGDWNASAAVICAPLPAEHTASQVVGFMQRSGFVNVPVNTNVRVNLTVIGYNT